MIAALAEPSTRGAIAVPLGRARDPRAILPLVAAIQARSVPDRCDECAALAEIGHPSAVAPLVPLLKSVTWETRSYVAQTLGRLKDPRAIDPLTGALKDLDPRVRATAATALGAIGDRRAVPPLIAALTDDAQPVRGAIALALASLGDRAAVDPIARVLLATLHDAAVALAKLKDPRGVPPLIAALSVRQPDREQVAHALGELADPRAVPALIRALIEPHKLCTSGWLQREAAWALGEIGGPQATAALRRHLKEIRAVDGWAGEPQAIEAALQRIKRRWDAEQLLRRLRLNEEVVSGRLGIGDKLVIGSRPSSRRTRRAGCGLLGRRSTRPYWSVRSMAPWTVSTGCSSSVPTCGPGGTSTIFARDRSMRFARVSTVATS